MDDESIQTIKCCEMFNCYVKGWRSFSLGPGTFLFLCREHYLLEAREKFGLGYNVDYDTE